MTPYPFQSDVIDCVERGWREYQRQLIVMPTGAGKTFVFSHLADRQPGRTLILAHREELIDQAIDKLHRATGIFAGKEKAESFARPTDRVVVASVQTMIRRLDRWPADHFGLVVVDEAHHALAESYQTVLKHFNGPTRVLGVTATPDRGDKRNLGEYFQNIPAEVGLFDLIHDGYLCPITLKSIPLQIDLTKVKSVAGDLDAGELGSALEPYLEQIAAAIASHASFRRVLAFLPLIATSRKFVEACRGAGLTAEHVDGVSEDRREILERFSRWEFDVLSNAMLLTEGYDDPGIDCVVVLRPTRSRPLYAQMVGRGTRVAPGKENLLLLDFIWLHERHRIIHPASLIAKDEADADAITELSQARAASGGDSQPPLDLEGLATETESQREEALRKRLEQMRRRAGKSMSAEEFALAHHSMAAAEYQATMPWESLEVTPKQATCLKRAKIDLGTVRGRGHASALLSLYFGDQKVTLASSRQRWAMRQMGAPNWENATAAEARTFFAQRRQGATTP